MAGQLATAAVSFAVTALLARSLGARDYGVFYLAATLVQSAFVLADFGHEYYIVTSCRIELRRKKIIEGMDLEVALHVASKTLVAVAPSS